jgi:hypothetical protein
LENTDHFRFRFKKDATNTQPLTTLEAKTKTKIEEDKDDQIISNFDRMILNLEQQQRQAGTTQDGFNLALIKDDNQDKEFDDDDL